VFDPGQLARDRHGPDADRLIVARLNGIARRHGRRELTEAETATAAAELRTVASGRGDLLAEVAGIKLGFYEGRPEEVRARIEAELCRLAGADESLIPRWTEEGRRRAEAAQLPPFSRPRRAPRRL